MPFLFDSCIFPYFQPLNMLSPCPFETCLESRENLVPVSSCERAGSNSSMAFAHDVPSLMNQLIYFDWHSAEKFRMLPNTLIRKFLEPDPPVWKLDVYAAKRYKMQSKTNCHSPLNLPHKIRAKLCFFSILVSNLSNLSISSSMYLFMLDDKSPCLQVETIPKVSVLQVFFTIIFSILEYHFSHQHFD